MGVMATHGGLIFRFSVYMPISLKINVLTSFVIYNSQKYRGDNYFFKYLLYLCSVFSMMRAHIQYISDTTKDKRPLKTLFCFCLLFGYQKKRAQSYYKVRHNPLCKPLCYLYTQYMQGQDLCKH